MAGSCERHDICWKDYFSQGPPKTKRLPAKIMLCKNCNQPSAPVYQNPPLRHARQNYAPLSSHDAESIHAFLDKAQNELSPFQNEISRLRGLIKSLKAQKAQITKPISIHRSKSHVSQGPGTRKKNHGLKSSSATQLLHVRQLELCRIVVPRRRDSSHHP
ncbi:hypothetical protein C8J56DRAFT_92816 [Mycena floridula]|nr:hypothetical protein C8J56DRAFT_92816 [Mycena floridula]